MLSSATGNVSAPRVRSARRRRVPLRCGGAPGRRRGRRSQPLGQRKSSGFVLISSGRRPVVEALVVSPASAESRPLSANHTSGVRHAPSRGVAPSRPAPGLKSKSPQPQPPTGRTGSVVCRFLGEGVDVLDDFDTSAHLRDETGFFLCSSRRAASDGRFPRLDPTGDHVPIASLPRRAVQEKNFGSAAAGHEDCNLRASSHHRESRSLVYVAGPRLVCGQRSTFPELPWASGCFFARPRFIFDSRDVCARLATPCEERVDCCVEGLLRG